MAAALTLADDITPGRILAPSADRIRALIGDISEFARRRDIVPLTHVALAHAQFETIHPFTDGNGRALAHSRLRYLGVTPSVAVPVSAG
jgi:Fic family protein